jgi:hypothetical protein
MNIRNIPLYFILGGTILVSICLATEYINPTAGALVWGFPAIILFSYLILNYETKNRKLIIKTNKNVLCYFFIKLVFFLSLLYLLENTTINTNMCLLISVLLFFIIAVLIYFVLTKEIK